MFTSERCVYEDQISVVINLLLLLMVLLLLALAFSETMEPLNDRSNRRLALPSEVILRLSYDERKIEQELVLNRTQMIWPMNMKTRVRGTKL